MDKIEELKRKIAFELELLSSSYHTIDIHITIEVLAYNGTIKDYYRIDVVYGELNIRHHISISEAEDIEVVCALALRTHYEIINYEKEKNDGN